MVSVTALTLALETLLVQLKHQGYDSAFQLERVRLLEQRWKARKWTASGGVAELFAQVHAASHDASGAIRWYDTAIEVSDGDVSFKALEQRSNLLVREAWNAVEAARDTHAKLAKATAPRRGKRRAAKRSSATSSKKRATALRALQKALDSARTTIDEAGTLFTELTAFHATAERQSLRGSAMKRLALVEAVAGRKRKELQAIEAMKRHYQQAVHISQNDHATNLFYPAANYIAAELALHAGKARWKGLASSPFEVTRRSLQAKNLDDPDFWSVVGEIELDLFEAVAGGGLAAAQRDVVDRYEDLFDRMHGGSEWGSVYDTALFVLAKYQGRAPAAERQAARAVLDTLKGFAKPGA